jgi:sugar O-acyltransferase (sialic acid O-acetyltransferase NeuD family)
MSNNQLPGMLSKTSRIDADSAQGIKTTSEGIVLLGGGKHCKVVLDVLDQMGGYRVHGISDLPGKLGDPVVDGYKIDMEDAGLQTALISARFAFVSHGEKPDLRRKLYQMASKAGYEFPVLTSPFAYVSPYSRIGQGTLIVHGAKVNPSARVGLNAILNTGSVIEHDCVIGDHSHVAPGAVLCGGVQVGQMTMVGAGAVVIPDVRVGDNALIGAGAVVTKEVPSNTVVVGNPARIVRGP